MRKSGSILVGTVLTLLALGIVMLASTSGIQAESQFGDSNFFLKRQAMWLMIAIIAGLTVSKFDYTRLQKWALPLGICSIILLILTIIPGVGVNIKGARRWLSLGFIRFQSSEIAKITTILFLAWWMARIQRHTKKIIKSSIIPLAYLSIVLLLIFIEPDFGTTLLLALVGITIMFVAGSPAGYLFIASLVGLIGFMFAVMRNAERMGRIMAFLNPHKYAQGEAYQLLAAIKAHVTGGTFGVGFGQGIQKRFYLPEAHTDFIFAIIGEELGLVVSLLVVALFMVLFICGLKISRDAPDDFGRLLAFGFTLMITLQAAINMGVVTGCLPTKGLPLPFISFGGSSLVICMTMVGVLLNISQHNVSSSDMDKKAIKDRRHSF